MQCLVLNFQSSIRYFKLLMFKNFVIIKNYTVSNYKYMVNKNNKIYK